MHRYNEDTMEQPTYKFRQTDLLKGMTSALQNGACWGLTMAWIESCDAAGPSAAATALGQGTAALEALIAHSERGNQFLSGASGDNNILNGVVMLSKGKFDAARDTQADGAVSSRAGVSQSKSMAIVAALLSNVDDYYGLIIITLAAGRHAIAVTKRGRDWALFDPNYGTWSYSGDEALTKFPALLKDNFDGYKVTEVNLFKLTRMF
jgi:YopT-type cysteine protease-like protein